MTEFAALVATFRRERQWSMGRLALACQIDTSLTSRIERDLRGPTRATVAKLVAGLALDPREADALWLAAGLLPPDIDPQLVGRMLAFVRDAQANGRGDE
jgi:transcriptional regulator with XRE-family HTH domain